MAEFKVISRPLDAGGFRVVSRPEMAPAPVFSPAGVPYAPDALNPPPGSPVVQSANPDPYRALKIGTQGAAQGVVADPLGAPADIAGMIGKVILGVPEMAINAFLPPEDEVDFRTERFDNMALGSERIGGAAGKVADAAGFDRVPYDDMSLKERMGYQGTRLATGAVTGGAGLAKAGARAGATDIERVFAAPYQAAAKRAEDMGPVAGAVTKSAPLLADAGAGFGAGAGMEAAQPIIESLPEPLQPVASLIASLLGAQAGGRTAQAVAAPKAAVDKLMTYRRDRNVPLTEDNRTTSRATTDAAKRFMQDQVVGDRKEVAATIRENAQAYDEGLPMIGDEAPNPPLPKPTSGILSGDPGVIAVEQGFRVKNKKDFLVADSEVEKAAAAQTKSLRQVPEDTPPEQVLEAQMRPRDKFEGEVAQQRQTAAAETTAALDDLDATRKAGVERSIETQQRGNEELSARDAEIAATKDRATQAGQAEADLGAEVAARRGGETAASENLAAAADDAKAVDEAYKAGLYREAESLGKDVPVDPIPFAEDARAIKTEISRLAAQDSSLNNVLDDLDRLAKPIDGSVLDGAEPPADLKLADLIAMRPRLSQAREAAVRLKRGDVTERIDRINGAIKGEIDSLAEAGDEAAVAWQNAEANFRDNFAPKYREGTGRQLDQAERSKNPTPPSAVAGKFLKPAAGGKEAAEDLNRILSGAESEAAGKSAARDYVLADVGKVVGAEGKINPSRLRNWIANRTGMFEALPDLKAEADQMLRDVVNKREASTALQRELDVKTAERKTRAAEIQKEIKAVEGAAKLSEGEKTRKVSDLVRQEAELEAGIRKSAVSLFLDADPQTTVESVFKQRDPLGSMREIVGKLKGDKEALAGWKDAVAEHLLRKTLSVDTVRTLGDGQPVRGGALTKMLSDGRTMRALSQSGLFSPAEMNNLRRAHKMLENMQLKGVKATVGSPTAELQEQVLNNLEGALLLSGHNAVTTGMVMKRFRTMLTFVPGTPEKRAQMATDLIHRSAFDPELAAYLLDSKPSDIRLPQWNRKLMRYLALAEAARESTEANDEEGGGPLKVDIRPPDKRGPEIDVPKFGR